MRLKPNLTCNKHPDYQAVKPPKADCLECRLMYRAKLQKAKQRAEDAIATVNAMLNEKQGQR